eukprot:EG_transcript_918
MAREISELAQRTMNTFGAYVTNLMQANSQLVVNILSQQQQSSHLLITQTQGEMTHTIGILVNYTTNSTLQSQRQMNTVVGTFTDLMGTVVTDFKGLAGGYAAQVRADLAAKGSTAISSLLVLGHNIFNRLQTLSDVGLLNFSRAPTDPVGLEDCVLLHMICEYASELSMNPLTFASATGRLYRCGTLEGGTVSNISVSNGLANETHLRWPPYGSSVPAAAQLPMKQRCLSERPVVVTVGVNCPQSPGCQCGADPRCEVWYQQMANTTSTHFDTRVLQGESGVPIMNIAGPILDPKTTPPTLLGVVDWPAELSGFNALVISAVAGLLNNNSMAMLMNDTNLTTLASSGRKCATNETPPGDLNLPLWSSLRSCDPRLQEVAQWLSHNRSLSQPVALENSGLLWDITPVAALSFSYFFILSSNLTQINQPIDASEARAAAQLGGARIELLNEVEANGDTTRAYVSTVGAKSMAVIEAMHANFSARIETLQNSSEAALKAYQEQRAVSGERLNKSLVQDVDALKNKQLNEMALATGWTIAVVFVVLLLMLAVGTWGTVRVTNHLTHIIGLMEDVAEMKVDNLDVPQHSSVTEVARIQIAFQVLIRRLAEYKGYIPAGLFERGERETNVKDDDANDCGSPEPSCCTSVDMDREALSIHRGPVISPQGSPNPSPRRSVRRNVAVLSVNLMGFMDAMMSASDAVCRITFNEYITHVHEAVVQGRGHIDCILGDQIFVTFNAHINCADPAGAAAAAALEVRAQLLHHMGDRLRFQVGLAFGPTFASSVGYARFKAMLTMGSPLKLASMLTHIPRFENGTILTDASMEERVRYSYTVRPVELIHLPHLKSFSKTIPKSQRVYILLSKKCLEEDEWIYQVHEKVSDWGQTFDRLVVARSAQEGQSLLSRFLEDHPMDEVALRLRERLPLWAPGLGVAL